MFFIGNVKRGILLKLLMEVQRKKDKTYNVMSSKITNLRHERIAMFLFRKSNYVCQYSVNCTMNILHVLMYIIYPFVYSRKQLSPQCYCYGGERHMYSFSFFQGIVRVYSSCISSLTNKFYFRILMLNVLKKD